MIHFPRATKEEDTFGWGGEKKREPRGGAVHPKKVNQNTAKRKEVEGAPK